ncbi:MAG: alanine--glyoxylate aminotransferase family protein [Actinobacteria bacterium]|nr:alanine--glyoxylate aminotransferase family protein [Actinomycetota bacterium]MBU2687032.1 alanine--glyoxylate aminotransferase family protein [Actinomycetota bacterium]
MKKQYIYTPGPTPVPHEVAAAQTSMVHHRTDEFGECLARVLEGLKFVMQTGNEVMLLTASGTGAMEAAVANCFSPGDTVIVFSGGKFGERLVEISSRFGLDAVVVEYAWGDCADPAELEKALEGNPDARGVFLTQSETSTGVVNDVEAFGRIVRGTDALFLLDAISGLGAVDLKTDEWGVDLCIGGSQKGLMTPPGLAFVAVSDDAWKASAGATLPRYYFDLQAARKAQSGSPPQTPYTPAITLVQALDVALRMLREEGLEAVFARHELFARATQAAVGAMGLRFVASDLSRAFVCTSVWAPEGLKSGDLVKLLRNEYGVSIAGGQGKLKGKIFRLGHVGYFDMFDVIAQVAAVEAGLKRLGYGVAIGCGVAAALEVLAG